MQLCRHAHGIYLTGYDLGRDVLLVFVTVKEVYKVLKGAGQHIFHLLSQVRVCLVEPLFRGRGPLHEGVAGYCQGLTFIRVGVIVQVFGEFIGKILYF